MTGRWIPKIKNSIRRVYLCSSCDGINVYFTLRLYPVYNSTAPTSWRERSVQKYILHWCRNYCIKKVTVTNVLLSIEIHVALFGLQATHKLQQNSHHRQTSTGLCVCECVIISFILDVRLVDAPARVTQEEGHT